jgi:hypothetical protein
MVKRCRQPMQRLGCIVRDRDGTTSPTLDVRDVIRSRDQGSDTPPRGKNSKSAKFFLHTLLHSPYHPKTNAHRWGPRLPRAAQYGAVQDLKKKRRPHPSPRLLSPPSARPRPRARAFFSPADAL